MGMDAGQVAWLEQNKAMSGGGGGDAPQDATPSNEVDAGSDDFKQGYQDAMSGGSEIGTPRVDAALANYGAGFAQGQKESGAQPATQAPAAGAQLASKPPPTTSSAADGPPPNPDQSDKPAAGIDATSDDYKQGYQDGLNNGSGVGTPRVDAALADYDAGFAEGQKEAVTQGPPAPPTTTPEPQAPTAKISKEDAYKQGHDAGLSGALAQCLDDPDADAAYQSGYQAGVEEAKPVPLPKARDQFNENQQKIYDEGYAAGKAGKIGKCYEKPDEADAYDAGFSNGTAAAAAENGGSDSIGVETESQKAAAEKKKHLLEEIEAHENAADVLNELGNDPKVLEDREIQEAVSKWTELTEMIEEQEGRAEEVEVE